MAYIELDMSSEGFQPIPTGIYKTRIDDSEMISVKSGNNAGKPMIKWTFTVLAPKAVADALTGERVPTAGRQLIRNTPCWPGAAGFLKDLTRAAGVSLSGLGFDTRDLHGKTVMSEVTQREYQGAVQNDISRWFPVDDRVNDEDAPF